MRRITELRPADLDQVPVWRYEGENDDVAALTATSLRELRETDAANFIARTQFVLASGAPFVGFISPAGEPGLDTLQPVILTPEGPVYFWFEQPPSHEFLARQASMLGVAPDELFPVQFRCTVPVDGNYVTGVITADDLTGAA